MNNGLSNKIKKLEDHTFKGNKVWIVETDADERWKPYRVLSASGKVIERLPVMTYSEFLEWRKTIEAQPILDFMEGAKL